MRYYWNGLKWIGCYGLINQFYYSAVTSQCGKYSHRGNTSIIWNVEQYIEVGMEWI